jgi:PAS domain S-box-containing protein
MDKKREIWPDPMLGSLQANDIYRSLIDFSPLAIIGLTNEGLVTIWNHGAERCFGWTEYEVLGSPLPTVPLHAEEEFHRLLEANIRGESNQGVEITRIRKDGKPIAVSLWTTPVHDSEGHVRGNLALLAGATDRHRGAREKIDNSESNQQALEHARCADRFRDLLEAAPDAIIEVDDSGRIVLANAAMEKMFGYSRDELIGSSVDELLPQQLRLRHASYRHDYRVHPKSRPMGSGLELFARRKDGSSFPVEISLSPVSGQEGLHVSAFIRDITDRKQAEDRIRSMNENFAAELSTKNFELRMRNREVERADQLKSEFLSSMSHELRTPLHTVIGFADLLVEEIKGPLNHDQRRYVEYIQRDSRHLLELINDVLDLSKIEAGRVDLNQESFQPSEVIQEALSGLRPLASNKGITILEELAASMWITADRVRFKEIFYNLISNAIKFTPQRGQITVQSAARLEEAFFCVADTGVGIPQSEQERIFEKFSQVGSTTRGIREGTGLGLSITKHLVEMHRGKIWVESQVGMGSKFQFLLPYGALPQGR